MAPVTVTSAAIVEIFPPGSTQLVRQFQVLTNPVKVSHSRTALENGGGITYNAGTGRIIAGHPNIVSKPLYAIATGSDATVERDEA